MFTEERHQKIISILNKQQSISVNELTEKLNFSPATIRADLNQLNQRGLLIRTHGGATAITKNDNSTPIFENFSSRQKKNHEEKIQIANKTMQFIEEDACIILDASSTAFELAKLINESKMRLMIITNGLKTANLLKNNNQITTILIGGMITGDSNAIEGTLGIGILQKINIDAAFLSAHAFNLKDGMTDFNLYEVELKRKIIEEVDTIYAMIDYTKLNQSSIASFVLPTEIDKFITNKDKADSSILQEYSENEIEIV